MQFLKKFSPGDNTPDPCFRGEGSLFRSPKMYQNSLSVTAMQNSNISPDPRFWEWEVKVASLKLSLATPLAAMAIHSHQVHHERYYKFAVHVLHANKTF